MSCEHEFFTPHQICIVIVPINKTCYLTTPKNDNPPQKRIAFQIRNPVHHTRGRDASSYRLIKYSRNYNENATTEQCAEHKHTHVNKFRTRPDVGGWFFVPVRVVRPPTPALGFSNELAGCAMKASLRGGARWAGVCNTNYRADRRCSTCWMELGRLFGRTTRRGGFICTLCCEFGICGIRDLVLMCFWWSCLSAPLWLGDLIVVFRACGCEVVFVVGGCGCVSRSSWLVLSDLVGD